MNYTVRTCACVAEALVWCTVMESADKELEKEKTGEEHALVTVSKSDDMPVRKQSVLPTLWYDGNDKQRRSVPVVWCLALAFMVFAYGSYGVLMNLCKVDDKIPFSSPALNVLVESVKFLVAASLLTLDKQGRGEGWRWSGMPTLRQVLPFAVPAVLYSINNNLAVFMQVHMDPATYQVLGNLKIVTTAVLYRVILKRSLTVHQWISVGLLTTAGFCDSVGNLVSKGEGTGAVIDLKEQYVTVTGLLTILTYCLISALAGVYTEFILKRDLSTSLHAQNMMLYSFSITLHLAAWVLSQSFSSGGTTALAGEEEGSSFQLFKGFSVYTWLIIFTQAFNGLGMSVVFKHGSNLVRLLVISCAMVVSTTLSILVLGVSLNILFFLTLGLVVTAIYLYYH